MCTPRITSSRPRRPTTRCTNNHYSREETRTVRHCSQRFNWLRVNYIVPTLLCSLNTSIFPTCCPYPEEYDELGRLVRTCNDEVHVNKCEGFCNSQVQPSVISVTGFLKECFCCRETFFREKLIHLKHCYDPDGQRLMEGPLSSMEVRLKEPSECRCYKCGDFTRWKCRWGWIDFLGMKMDYKWLNTIKY